MPNPALHHSSPSWFCWYSVSLIQGVYPENSKQFNKKFSIPFMMHVSPTVNDAKSNPICPQKKNRPRLPMCKSAKIKQTKRNLKNANLARKEKKRKETLPLPVHMQNLPKKCPSCSSVYAQHLLPPVHNERAKE